MKSQIAKQMLSHTKHSIFSPSSREWCNERELFIIGFVSLHQIGDVPV